MGAGGSDHDGHPKVEERVSEDQPTGCLDVRRLAAKAGRRLRFLENVLSDQGASRMWT